MNPDSEILSVEDLLSDDAISKWISPRSREASEEWISRANRSLTSGATPSAPPSSRISSLEETKRRREFADKVAGKVKKELEHKNGACFRTEIRDSKVFICGVHQNSVWEDGVKKCTALDGLLEIIRSAVVSSMANDGDAPLQSSPVARLKGASYYDAPAQSSSNDLDIFADEEEDLDDWG